MPPRQDPKPTVQDFERYEGQDVKVKVTEDNVKVIDGNHYENVKYDTTEDNNDKINNDTPENKAADIDDVEAFEGFDDISVDYERDENDISESQYDEIEKVVERSENLEPETGPDFRKGVSFQDELQGALAGMKRKKEKKFARVKFADSKSDLNDENDDKMVTVSFDNEYY